MHYQYRFSDVKRIKSLLLALFVIMLCLMPFAVLLALHKHAYLPVIEGLVILVGTVSMAVLVWRFYPASITMNFLAISCIGPDNRTVWARRWDQIASIEYMRDPALFGRWQPARIRAIIAVLPDNTFFVLATMDKKSGKAAMCPLILEQEAPSFEAALEQLMGKPIAPPRANSGELKINFRRHRIYE